tara:strand:- start:763 stop:942 length:180 start_codon:yes stop_codon:yes gene_type:complete
LSKILIKSGQKVKKGESLFVIEAMKMESNIAAPKDGTVKEIVLNEGNMVTVDDLVLVLN